MSWTMYTYILSHSLMDHCGGTSSKHSSQFNDLVFSTSMSLLVNVFDIEINIDFQFLLLISMRILLIFANVSFKYCYIYIKLIYLQINNYKVNLFTICICSFLNKVSEIIRNEFFFFVKYCINNGNLIKKSIIYVVYTP